MSELAAPKSTYVYARLSHSQIVNMKVSSSKTESKNQI
jgi:hypothetical protein